MSILFIDDDDIRTRPLRENLIVFGGFDVVFVQTPDGAVKKFDENPGGFQAVVVDIMMQHYNISEYRDFTIPKYFSSNSDGMYTGLLVLQQLQKIMDDKNLKVPVIVLSCIEDIAKYLSELNLKVDRILLKPIFLGEFMKEVKNVVPPK